MALKPLTLEQLMGAPLRALIMGQGATAQATAEFVSEVGFERTKDGNSVVRQLEFEYTHPMPDPANPGGIIETPTKLRVPLLTLFSVPSISISEATVSFGANIVTARQAPAHNLSFSLERKEAGGISSPVQLIGVYAPVTSAAGQPAPTLNVSIKVTKEPTAEGLARILDILSDAITSVPKTRKE